MANLNNPEAGAKVMTAEEDYQQNFMPAVHRIGQSTMAIAFCLSFLPVAYFIVVKGYGLPFATYLNVMIAIGSVGIGMWLTEPLSYWPVLGSAGTYIAYLSGNVGGMRFPVSLAVQAAMNADINTPRGQVATIAGIVGSVFSNLAILLVIVLGGEALLKILPTAVIASFAFTMPSLYGSMLYMRFNGPKGVLAGFLDCLPYLLVSMSIRWAVLKLPFFAPVSKFGTAFSVGATILFGYVMWKVKTGKKA